MSARVARLCPPGQWWYVAVCADCAWSSTLTWKHKGWAITEAEIHNNRRHGDPSQTSASVDALPADRAASPSAHCPTCIGRGVTNTGIGCPTCHNASRSEVPNV